MASIPETTLRAGFERARAELAAVGMIAGFGARTIERLVAEGQLAATLQPELLAAPTGGLESAQVRAFAVAAAVYMLVDRDVVVATAIRGAVKAQSDEDVSEILARMTADEIGAALEAARVPLTTDKDAKARAARIEARFAALHPGVAFVSRLPRLPRATVARWIEPCKPLFERNAQVFGVAWEELELDGIDDASRARLAAIHGEARRGIRAYTGLDLATIFDDRAQSASARGERVERLVNLVHEAARNAGADNTLRIDYGPRAGARKHLGLEAPGISDAEAAAVISTFKGYQRCFTVAAAAVDAERLASAGYASARQIARDGEQRVASAAGLSPARAAVIVARARDVAGEAATVAGALLDRVSDWLDDSGAGNAPPSTNDEMGELGGIEALFGAVGHCACKACNSILGPAAYFVDLMAFVEEHLQPLGLRTRRPDLWTLELTCANTTERVPVLQLVDEILEQHVADASGFSGDADARRSQVYALLATADGSFRQPFDLSLARITASLTHLEADRADVAAAIGADARTWASAALGLSMRDRALITTPEPDLATLRRRYGLAFEQTDGVIAPVDTALLMPAMGLTRAELGALCATAFVAVSGASISVRSEKRDDESVQNDVENVHGLTPAALDRMHRLARLRRRAPWPFDGLDRLLTSLTAAELSDATVDAIARTRAVQTALNLDLDETAALVGVMSPSLFDQVFNRASLVGAGGAYPQDTVRFVHPALRATTPAAADPHLGRLQAALGLDVGALGELVLGLAPQLGFAADGPEDERGCLLTASNLGLLHRHARFARALRVSVGELMHLLEVFAIGAPLASPARVWAAYDALRWLRSSGYALDDVAVATGKRARDPSRYIDPALLAQQAVDGARAALELAPTALAVATGISESAALAVVAANSHVLVPSSTADRLRLADGVDLSSVTITIPPGIVTPAEGGPRPLDDSDVRIALSAFAPGDVLARRLGSVLRITTDRIEAMAGFAGIDLGSIALATALREEVPAPIMNVIVALRPARVAFASAAWSGDAIAHVTAHPAAYDLATPGLVTVASMRALAGATRFLAAGADLLDLHAVIDSYVATGTPHEFPPSALPTMARVLGASTGLLHGLRGRVAPGTSAVDTLLRVAGAAAAATRLDIDGELLAAIASSDAPDLARAADALTAAIASRAGAQALAGLEMPLLEARRDALVDHVLRTLQPGRFGDAAGLSAHLLLDLEAGGCQTTSRVIAATGSVQQYVQRVILGREHHGETSLAMPPAALVEWSWRKNYRVWEANRKVFLWPENYLDPDLRDDKTPLCEALERELFQTDVNDIDVADAYAAYLKGFDELASLTIAGAYHDTGADELHLFGVTAADPPVYYYRRCDGLLASGRDPARGVVWGPWHRVELQIGSRRIAPVVVERRLHVFWVDLRTRSTSKVSDGTSAFDGYHHTMRMYFTTMRADGQWTPPQQISLPREQPFHGTAGLVIDGLQDGSVYLDHEERRHVEPLDDYGLTGVTWEGVWPDVLPGPGRPQVRLGYRNVFACGTPDLFRRTINVEWPQLPPPPPLLCARGPRLYWGTPIYWLRSAAAMANAVVEEAHLDVIDHEQGGFKALLQHGLYAGQVATLAAGAQLYAIPGNLEDAIVQVGADVVLLQGSITPDTRYVARRLGTTLADDVNRRLFTDGIAGLLDTATQRALAEAGLPLTTVGGQVIDRSNAGKLDFTGPYGTYFRELFFHVPSMIAHQLNARGRFADAQRWLHAVFDPGSTEVVTVPPGTPDAERQARIRDRVWRYLELRGRSPGSLRATLTDPEALEKYRSDPFNPHAIARLRLSAYQRGVVFAYVDNLLDWADHLFTQFTMESVGEAMTLYQTAAELLGARPAEVGDCGESAVQPRTYEVIAPLLDGTDDLLVELETWTAGRRYAEWPAATTGTLGAMAARVAHAAVAPAAASVAVAGVGATDVTQPPLADATTRRHAMSAAGIGPARMRKPTGAARSFALGPIRQVSPAFCLPPNPALQGRRDRVADRLFKVRNCLDIDGKPRELALLSPELDPGALARMKADGLTLDDVAASTSGALPPYRFLYVVDRAKALASTLAGFGSALLGALEKRDGEALARLRTVHQQTLGAMTTRHREREIEIAEETLEALRQQRLAAEERAGFYGSLLDVGRTGWEMTQTVSRHLAGAVQAGVAAPIAIGAVLSLLPQYGSPFAMTYGGIQLSAAQAAAAQGLLAGATHLEMLGASAGLEASFDRRREGWQHQQSLAKKDVAILDRNIAAAVLRVDVTRRSLALHHEGLAQIDEVLALMDGRFTSRGLYTWMAQTLGRLYRDAYLNALALARLAEEAYRFERGGDAGAALSPSHWDPGKAGLLAGERLLIELQGLERRFLESHHRRHEIDQTFSLQQIAPAAMAQLRETGTCELEIPEFYFDLYYPGQLRRRIKGVRVTMPCITGPFVNVAARLELLASWMRMAATAGAPLVEVPPRRTTSIATSTAQNDAGVFELSFRDERYMPFEGAGAISRWRLTLPRAFRPFDYQTLTDVILSISYDADHDEELRRRVEAESAALEGSLAHWVATHGLGRLFSLRQDFSPVWTRVLRTPVGTEVGFEIGPRHFPVFAQGRTLIADAAWFAIRLAEGVDAAGLRLSIDGVALGPWTPQPGLGGLLAAPLPPGFAANLRGEHRVAVTDVGGLGPADGSGALDPARVLDALISVEYRLT